MMIITENIEHARTLASYRAEWRRFDSRDYPAIVPLIEAIFDTRQLFTAAIDEPAGWSHILIIESSAKSQFDIVNALAASNIYLPHGILCLAGRGNKFHGFRGRPWVSPTGNIYLTVYLAPGRKLDNFGAAFLMLAAVSVIDTVDNIKELEGKAGIKWVNDILINGAKICGVLAHTQQEGDQVTSAVLGIGLNVLATPDILPTAFVPRAASLKDYLPVDSGIDLKMVFANLSQSLLSNYDLLVRFGYRHLLDKYRQRSLIINREVEVCLDLPADDNQILCNGVVEKIGENLELYLRGNDKPITKGRLILKN